ncbi:unnamed protein product [Clavelina lepadiformis]|uniref:non-specific serine/threonine protein kinase n=1 Tax=Clavelina lepadiformis TaxID=159417 RepID=A0ABP0H434_CLALP
MEDHSELKDLSVELLCSRCSKLTPFRDVLKLSFDEETLLEERLHKAPVEMCTCHVTFPPPNLENTTLKEIHLAHNKLSTVEPFSELTQSTKSRLFHSTTHLFLQNNQISSFPRKVALIFQHLVELSLSNNSLTTFPFEVLKHCTHLETLDVSENQIKDSFPMFLLNPASFKEITEKGTGENQRKSSKVTHPLKTLKLGCNCLVLFPLWVPPILSKLIHLDLKQNEIASFISPENCCDEELGSSAMLHLKSLNLSRNKISTIFPSSFVCMPSLAHLDVSENRIEKVDNSSQDDRLLVKLENLNLSSNILAEIPQIVPFLPNLQCLSLSNNIIKHVPVPKLWKTKQLKELDLSHNAISDISDLANMLPSYWSSLRSLNLANNQINLLSPSIGDLKNLEILDISHNQLKTLPDEIGHLNRLMKLGIKENNLNLDNSIINGRAQDICKFLYARLKKSVPQNSLKLMLVGDAGAGKTTLLQSLIKAKTKTRRLSESLAVSVSGVLDTRQQTVLATVGVDVVDLPLKHSNGVFQLSAWDFAGQEDFFATHPCFLSERAMYVAVYDASKGPEQLHTLKPWLTAIHARATFCPVLVVGTHSDMLPFKTKQETISLLNQELETLSHQEWFPQGAYKYDLLQHELVDVREGSSGIYRLKAVIADIVANSVVNGHPLVGSMIPHSYVQLSEILMEEAAKRETFPVISYNELANLIHKKSNEQNPQFESGSELMLAVRYLHQTGVLLHFDEPRSRLRDCFFIKPVWLCQLLARVTTMKEDKSFKINPYINQEGILSKTQFQRNFINERTIDSRIASQFLPRLFRLLENFEVILWQGGDHYLVPSKLPNKKPEFTLPVCQVCKKLIRFFSMIYIPMGFWPRLIARLLAFEEKLLLGYNSSFITAPNLTPSVRKIWKEGLYLEWEAHNSKQKPFVLVQAGCQEFEAQTSYHDEPLKHLAQSSQTQAEGFEMVNFGGNISKQEGLEVVVSRDSAGKILLGQLVDHINGLIEEWYPGLLKTDMRGQCLFQQFCPCLGCVDLNAFTPTKVKIYCIGDIAESILCNKSMAGISSQSNHKPLIRKSDGIYLTCLNHQDTPARVADFAPEINLDDFDKTLHLNPQMLDFRQTPSRILGDGGFGSVYQATYDGEEVAVKTFHILTADMSYKMLRAELHVLAQYHHPSVVALKGFIPPAYSTPNLPLPLLALEYAKYGSLGKLLKDTAQLPVEARKSALPLALKHRVAYDITDGLCFLHSRNIIYRDMKPDNILLVSLDPLSPATAKITDYGIATLVSPFGTPGPSGTPGYSAPEVVTLKTGGKDKPSDLFPYSSKCDIYSFGLVFHEIAVGMSPWVDYVYQVCSTQGFTTSTLSEPDDIIMKGILPSAISSYEGAESWPCAEQLITNCLLHNPDERPTSHQIVSILSKVDSLGLRMSSPLHQSKVMCTALHPFSHANIQSPVKRSFSVPYDKLPKGPHESATVSRLTLCFTPVQPSHEKPGQKLVMQTILDLSKGHIVQENVFTKLEDHHDVTCILSLPKSPGESVEYMEKTKNTKPSSYTNSMLLFGTKQGCLLLLSESEISVKTRFSCQVESVFLHQPYSPKTLRHSFSTSSPHVQSVCFVVIGLENACMAVFPLEKIITQDTINPLHKVSLCDVASHSPITAITAVNGAAMYATCGRHIVSLRVSSSGQPSILASFQARDHIDNFVVGLHHMYVNAHASSLVEVWRVGSACLKSSIDTKQVVLSDNEKLQEIDVVVTCLTYHQHNPSLWVGLSSGHMIVYSDPHHNPLAIVRRHYGPITQLLALEEDESSLSKGVVVCIGEGMRSFSRDLEETSEVDGFGETRKNKIPPRKLTSSYATIWDADLPAKASNLYDILAARRAYSNSA